MSYLVKIKGKKIDLGVLHLDDLETITGWINDLKISSLLTGTSLVYDTSKEKKFLDSLLSSDAHEIFGILSKRNELMGICGLHDIHYKNRTADLGIFIGDQTQWEKGYGKEACQLLIDYGFYFLNLYNIRLVVYAYNKRAIKLYETLGFKEIGRRRGSVIFNNEHYDTIYMDLLQKEVNNQFSKFIENK